MDLGLHIRNEKALERQRNLPTLDTNRISSKFKFKALHKDKPHEWSSEWDPKKTDYEAGKMRDMEIAGAYKIQLQNVR